MEILSPSAPLLLLLLLASSPLFSFNLNFPIFPLRQPSWSLSVASKPPPSSTSTPSILPSLPPSIQHPDPSIDRILANARSAIDHVNAEAANILRRDGVWEESLAETGLFSSSLNPANRVHANSYVDLGLVTTVGFDYDYTIVQYNDELLNLIYDIAKEKLVKSNDYPTQILNSSFDPTFSIRGLAVDRKTGWICHLSMTHKVAIAYEGRRKVERERIRKEFSNKRSLTPREREKRLKPLNDLFSMAECSLVADVIETFINDGIPYHAPSVVNDVLKVIGETHMSFEFHRAVKKDPAKYLEDRPGMKEVLDGMKSSGKSLLLVSNSPFWYVDAGMKHILGDSWRDYFECVVAEAGKPAFYTDGTRPFREVNTADKWETKSFEMVEELKPGKVYAGGCLKELVAKTPCLKITTKDEGPKNDLQADVGGGGILNSNVLYIGDSLFADLVDAKREYGWKTAGVLAELEGELKGMKKPDTMATKKSIEILLSTLRLSQEFMGAERTVEDLILLDALEQEVSHARDRLNACAGNSKFGSIFKARHQPSLFAQSLRRYCDLYFGSVVDLLDYSFQHRFYPTNKGLGHEEDGLSETDNLVLFGFQDTLEEWETDDDDEFRVI